MNMTRKEGRPLTLVVRGILRSDSKSHSSASNSGNTKFYLNRNGFFSESLRMTIITPEKAGCGQIMHYLVMVSISLLYCVDPSEKNWEHRMITGLAARFRTFQ
jgi:hypothetical protein